MNRMRTALAACSSASPPLPGPSCRTRTAPTSTRPAAQDAAPTPPRGRRAPVRAAPAHPAHPAGLRSRGDARVRPRRHGRQGRQDDHAGAAKPANSLPVQIEAQTNTFFSKVRRVNGSAISYLHPKTLRPSRYTEDATENEQRRKVDVAFSAKDRSVQAWTTRLATATGPLRLRLRQGGPGRRGRHLPDAPAAHEGRPAGLLRRLRHPPHVADDGHGGGARARVAAPGRVRRLAPHRHRRAPGQPTQTREVHVWITDDDRRLPLAAVGAIDLGAVRATLTSFSRPGEKGQQAQGKESLKW